jgi:hypothetical protein
MCQALQLPHQMPALATAETDVVISDHQGLQIHDQVLQENSRKS